MKVAKILIGLALFLYSCFVVKTVWGWFAVPIFKAANINIAGAIGLMALVYLLRGGQSSNDDFEFDIADSFFKISSVLLISFIAHKFM
ncbi:hypothetical protein [Tatumella sp. UCD-D_suzukii]|uniref:hypothetical protein n=1 Tax=Tatumella sp. UCD-D_suzukii TaxID=1408192 RepID=UPI00047070CB|nr:hypothetical protein [Tatumella sp. UCD-D_suzukii]